jgi:hypothetical protein
MKYIKSVGVPIMYYILVETEEDNDELVIASAKEMLIDLVEENWEDQFEYGNSTLEFEAIDWLSGAYVHTVESREEDDEVEKAIEDGVSAESRGLRAPDSAVPGAREREEEVPL